MSSDSMTANEWRRPPKVLVVEDDEIIVELVSIRLAQVGYKVTHAPDGAEALKVARATAPDVIVLDLHMPNLDGFGFLARRRINPEIADLPVIVRSAAQRATDVSRALAMGATDYITKPIDMARLLRRVGLLLPKDVRRPVQMARVWAG